MCVGQVRKGISDIFGTESPFTQDVPPCEQDLSFTSHKLHLDLSFTGHELHLQHLKAPISIITPSTHPRQLRMPHPEYSLLFDRIISVFSLMCLLVRASVYHSFLLSHTPLRLDSDLNPKPSDLNPKLSQPSSVGL